MNNFSDYNNLPLTLSAEDISKVLGISKSACYNIFRREDFPAIIIGKRKLVSRDKFLEWLNNNTRRN